MCYEPIPALLQPKLHRLHRPANPVWRKLHRLRKFAITHHPFDGAPRYSQGFLQLAVADGLRQKLGFEGSLDLAHGRNGGWTEYQRAWGKLR